MGKTIIKIEPEWNGAHAFLEGIDYNLFGWVELPSKFQTIWDTNKPFIQLAINDEGEIIDVSPGEEISPDVEEVRSGKLAALSEACKAAIIEGCYVTLSDGTTGHISLTNEDQINLTNAVAAVDTGAAQYPYHFDGKLCMMFSAADILIMGRAATAHKLYHTTYYNHLAAWVNRCETVKEVEAIEYGDKLPEDLAASMANILEATANV